MITETIELGKLSLTTDTPISLDIPVKINYTQIKSNLYYRGDSLNSLYDLIMNEVPYELIKHYPPIGLKGKFARGNWGKRVSNYLHHASIEFDDNVLTQLASIIKENVSLSKQVDKLMFTQNINWEVGTWYDGGSCYFGNRSKARELLIGIGGGAFQFWNGGRKVTRCWTVKLDNDLIIWNSSSTRFQLKHIADVLTTLSGFKSVDIRPLTFGHMRDGMFYSNNNVGILIRENIDGFSGSYDIPVVGNRQYWCSNPKHMNDPDYAGGWLFEECDYKHY